MEKDGEWALQYGAGRGYEPLVTELISKLKRDQNIIASEENILITNGSSQAITLICDVLCDPGDVIISEQPIWLGAVRMLPSTGAEIRTIPVDQEGTDTAALERELKQLASEGRRPKLLYVLPNFQNPTGVTTTLERRQRIVELAQEYGVPIVEDDAYSDLRYSGERLPTIYSLDDSGLAIYLGTFSKTIAAGVRLGWMVASPEIIGAAGGLKGEGGTSPFAGSVAAEFCANGTLVEHVEKLLHIYRGRRDAMLDTLKSTMPEGVNWTTPEGGFFVWLTLPKEVTAARIAAAARSRGVEVLPGTTCYYDGGGQHELRLSFSFADEPQIREGLAILSDVIRHEMSA